MAGFVLKRAKHCPDGALDGVLDGVVDGELDGALDGDLEIASQYEFFLDDLGDFTLILISL